MCVCVCVLPYIDKLFRCITTLQYSKTRRTLEDGIENRPNLS